MEAIAKPALNHIFQVFVEYYNGEIIYDQFENFYSIISAYIQWKFLFSNTTSSLFEGLHGFQRVNTSETNKVTNISDRLKLLSFAYLIILPRLIEFLRDFFKNIRENIRTRNNETFQHQQNIPRSINTFRNHINIIIRTLKICGSFTLKVLAEAFPYMEAVGNFSCSWFKLFYLLNATPYHHPLFALLNMQLRKVKPPTSSSTSGNPTPRTSPANQKHSGLNWQIGAVVGVIVAVRVTEWFLNESGNQASNHLSQRLAEPIPIPPPPQPPKISNSVDHGQSEETFCPVCKETIKNPCAIRSGYVFCYLCILPIVRDSKKCPITGHFCRELDIIRLYESD